MPRQIHHRATAQRAHIVAVRADDVECLGEGARVVLHGEDEYEVFILALAHGLRLIAGAGESGEAGGVVLGGADVAVEHAQAEDLRRLVRGDGAEREVVRLADALGGHGGVGVGLNLIAVALDILVALAQRLRMADDGADGIRRGTVHAEQAMGDVEIEHLVDEQLAREEQIHHRADLAGVAVFEREDDAVDLAV